MSLAKHANTTTAPSARASRRSMLSGAALAFTAAASAVGITAGAAASVADLVPTEPDAELIALCAQFDGLERRRQDALNSAVTDAEDDAADLVAKEVRRQQRPLLDQICALRAVSLQGMGAIAASFVLWDGDEWLERDEQNARTDERLKSAMLRSLLAGRA